MSQDDINLTFTFLKSQFFLTQLFHIIFVTTRAENRDRVVFRQMFWDYTASRWGKHLNCNYTETGNWSLWTPLLDCVQFWNKVVYLLTHKEGLKIPLNVFKETITWPVPSTSYVHFLYCSVYVRSDEWNGVSLFDTAIRDCQNIQTNIQQNCPPWIITMMLQWSNIRRSAVVLTIITSVRYNSCSTLSAILLLHDNFTNSRPSWQ